MVGLSHLAIHRTTKEDLGGGIVMNAEYLWEDLLHRISPSIELHTIPTNKRTPRWFKVQTVKNNLIITPSEINRPSVELSSARTITFRDFDLVYGYFDKWSQGQVGIRHEVSRLSRNTAYIFALIDFSKIK